MVKTFKVGDHVSWNSEAGRVRLAQGCGVETSRLNAGREFESTVTDMAFPFFTIGHSTRPIGEFIDLLSLRRSASSSMCALFRARGQIRNTISKRFLVIVGFSDRISACRGAWRSSRAREEYCA
jgi:hypothetical protein